MGCKYRRERKEIHGHTSSLVIIKFVNELDEAKFGQVKSILATERRVWDIHYRGRKVSFQSSMDADIDFLVEVLEKNGYAVEE